MSKVGLMIRKARKAKGMSQSELSYEMRTPQQAISAWENGRNEPNIASLERIAAVLDIELPWASLDDEVAEDGDSRDTRRYLRSGPSRTTYAA